MPTAAQLSENSHQGFDGLKAALCLGSMPAKSNAASGMPVCLWRKGTGSRSSGKERDAETGLDYFGARYLSAAQGRFTSPDSGVDQHPSNPQSWNLYSYARNNPLLYVDPTGEYVCGKSMTSEQCTEFQNGLDKAQTAANKLKDRYGEDSDRYIKAQGAIDAYGKADVKNGVTVEIGNTGKYGGIVTVSDTTGPKTQANPTGQQITATFAAGVIGNALSEVHEGSHVADASAWVRSGFSNAMNPTQYQHESDGFRAAAFLGEGMGYATTTMMFGGSRTYTIGESPYLRSTTNDYIKAMLKKEYKLTPDSKIKAFQSNTRGGR